MLFPDFRDVSPWLCDSSAFGPTDRKSWQQVHDRVNGLSPKGQEVCVTGVEVRLEILIPFPRTCPNHLNFPHWALSVKGPAIFKYCHTLTGL